MKIKAIAAVLIVLIILNLIFFIFKIIKPLIFWLVIIAIALIAYKILPYYRKKV